jgi:hypothetical protein
MYLKKDIRVRARSRAPSVQEKATEMTERKEG